MSRPQLGGAVAQSLIAIDWRGLASKSDFTALQSDNPLVLALGREDQRNLALAAAPRREPAHA
jgi:[acyl-carrier-protein] S-malonyltransferase